MNRYFLTNLNTKHFGECLVANLAFFWMPGAGPMDWVAAESVASTMRMAAGFFKLVGAPGGCTLDLWEKSVKMNLSDKV